jgi:hypothetical protein
MRCGTLAANRKLGGVCFAHERTMLGFGGW